VQGSPEPYVVRGAFESNWVSNLVSRLDTRVGLWNIDSNDLLTDGWVPDD
jgi:hypothetical protein